MQRQAESKILKLKLALDFSSAGTVGSKKRGSFEALVIGDLARAAGVDAACFAVTDLQPGSIIARVRISCLDGGGAGCNPGAVVADLALQAGDASSDLMVGALTKHTLSVEEDTSKQGQLSGVENTVGTRPLPPVTAEEEAVLKVSPVGLSGSSSPPLEEAEQVHSESQGSKASKLALDVEHLETQVLPHTWTCFRSSCAHCTPFCLSCSPFCLSCSPSLLTTLSVAPSLSRLARASVCYCVD